MSVPATGVSTHLSSLLTLELQSDGIQRLTVFEEACLGFFGRLAVYSQLSSELQDIHCVLNTASQTLHVWVNGVWMGAHGVSLIASPWVTATVQIQAGAGNCEFDRCEVSPRSFSGTSVENPP